MLGCRGLMGPRIPSYALRARSFGPTGPPSDDFASCSPTVRLVPRLSPLQPGKRDTSAIDLGPSAVPDCAHPWSYIQVAVFSTPV